MINDNTPALNFISALCKEGVQKEMDVVILEEKVMVHFMILEDSEKDIGMRTIESKEPGSGYGSIALGKIIQLADKFGVNLWVDISPSFNTDAVKWGISFRKLIEWYKRHGFKQDTASMLYVRYAAKKQ